MKHELLLLGKSKDSYLDIGIDDYRKRLKHYTRFSVRYLKEGRGARGQGPQKEGKILLDAVPSGWLIVALDPRGVQLNSEKFAEKISNWEVQAVKGVSYLIGGPLGLSAEVREKADFLLSLSRMTHTHDMTRLILAEQIYRAYTIKAGEKYHK